MSNSEFKQNEIGHRLDDSVIARIAQAVQEAIITGTDVVDRLRLMELTLGSDGKFVLTERYRRSIEREHGQMLDEIEGRRRLLNENEGN